METDDFINRLEKAAEMFLNLLQMNKYYNVQLSSLSIVCKVICFIQSHSKLESISSQHVKEDTTHPQPPSQTSKNGTQISENKVESAIALTVKRRREQIKQQTNIIETKRNIKRKRKSVGTKSSNYVRNKHTKHNVTECDTHNVKNEDVITEHSKEQPHTNCTQDNSNPDPPISSHPDQLSDLQCSYCNKVFIDRRNLKSHLWVHEREKTFQCEVCKKLFLRSHQLTRHRRVHTGEKPYQCSVCGKAFADVSNLNTHKRKEHPDHVTLLLRCDQCGKECQSENDLKIHLTVHNEEDAKDKLWREIGNLQEGSVQNRVSLRLQRTCATKTKINGVTFLCQICGKSLNKRAALLAHMKRHIRKKDFRCEFCNKVFPELRELKFHRREHSGDRPYKCDKCGKGFKSQGTLRSHLSVHSGDQPYSCDVCGRTFSQTSGLNQHKLKHTAEEERAFGSNTTSDQQHNCDICGRCYKTKFRLQLHFRSHDSKQDVSCDFCDKKFQTAQDLVIHRRSHTKDKYSCRVCGASFKSRSVYYFHTRTHQIDRPYLCSACGKSFISANDLNAHKRRHTVGNILTKPHEQFICNVCGRIYQMKNSLFIHMKIHQGIFDHPCDFCEKKFKSHAELRHHRRVHTQEKPYTCETCNRHFSRHSTLVNHRRTHSGERPYMCSICGAAFKLSCTLKKHAKIHTREARGGKRRPQCGESRTQGQKSVPVVSTQEHQLQQIQPQELLHSHQIQHPQHSSLQQSMQNPISIAASHLMQNVPMLSDDREKTNSIHELKPVTTSIMHTSNSGLIHDRNNILDPRNSTSDIIQEPMRDGESNIIDDRQTARNLIELRNVVPNPIQYNTESNTFTAYYYY